MSDKTKGNTEELNEAVSETKEVKTPVVEEIMEKEVPKTEDKSIKEILKEEPKEKLTKEEETEIVEKKKVNNKNLIVIGVNFMLALISVYVFEYWAKNLFHGTLTTLQIAENIGVVVLTALTYFVGKTYYTKGVLNNIKKILITFLLAAAVLGLMLLSVNGAHGLVPADMVHPLSGIIVVSIAFYMLSLTAGTLNIIGIVALTMFFGAFISFAKLFGWIDWGWVGHLSKLAVFVILFFGGTWAQIRMYLHGVRGVNKDGGGFGGSDNNGDAGDGDGDTGDED